MRDFITDMLVSLLLVTRNFFRLIFYPYKTMRQIVNEKKDIYQITIIFSLIYLYFVFGNAIRRRTLHPLVISSSSFAAFSFFFATFLIVTLFFYILGSLLESKVKYRDIFYSFSYSLFPTLIWFLTTSVLYFILPPPRTGSVLGRAFSFVFIAFSIILFLWRTILFYLSLRFSLKIGFYRIIYLSLLFLAWFLPYSVFMYKLRIFRVPFI